MEELDSVCVLEQSQGSPEILVTWSYPSVDQALESVLVARAKHMYDTREPTFIFSRFQKMWHYIFTVSADTEKTPDIRSFSICVVTKSFFPERYRSVLQVLATAYGQAANPLDILALYLRLTATGQCVHPVSGEKYAAPAMTEQRRSLLATPLTDVTTALGRQSVLLWAAVLLKKNILVYSESVPDLLKHIRAVPLLAFHRQNWDVLRPYITVSAAELHDARDQDGVVAGTTDPSARTLDMWDVVVDLSAKTVTISDNVSADFELTVTHREAARAIVGAGDNAQQLVRDLTVLVQKYLSNLKGWKEKGIELTPDSIAAQQIPPPAARFLSLLATADAL